MDAQAFHDSSMPTYLDDKQANEEGALQFLIFSLNDALFGVNLMLVKEISQYGIVTMVPLMPSYIKGVINLRGSVIPIIDLSARFNHGITAVNKRSCIVILDITQEGESNDIGILVDDVAAVLKIEQTQIEPAPAFGASVRSEFIAGISKFNERFVVLLDIAKTLPLDDLADI